MSTIAPSVLAYFSIAVIKISDQNLLGEKGVYCIIDYRPTSREYKAGTQGRILEVGTEVETTGECCLWAFSMLMFS